MKKIINILIIFILLLSSINLFTTTNFATSNETHAVEYGVNPIEILPKTRTSLDSLIINKVENTLSQLDELSTRNDLNLIKSNEKINIKNYDLKKDLLRNVTYWDIETLNYDIELKVSDNSILGIYNNMNSSCLAEDTTEDNAENVAYLLYDSLNFPNDYELVYLKKLDDNTWESNFQKKYNNIYNKYESVKMFFNPTTQEIISLTMFNEKPTETDFIYSIEDIKENINAYNESINYILKNKFNENYFHEIKNKEAELAYVKPNTFFTDNNENELELQEVRKAWKLECTGNLIVYIDTENGKLIKGDKARYEEAQVQNANFFPLYDRFCVNSAKIGFQKLGYNTSETMASESEIRNWISDSSGAHYGYFIVTHGNNTGGNLSFDSSEGTKIYPSDIKGNWHLVFIDACYSKDNNQFAQAFKITGYSNRAYLGWEGIIYESDDTSFQAYFWENEVTTSSIQQAAKDAASRVPGSGTTPIRFSGDTSWWGYAS